MGKYQKRRSVSLNPRQYLLAQKIAGNYSVSGTLGRLLENAALRMGIEVSETEVKAFCDAEVARQQQRDAEFERERKRWFS